MNCEFCNTPFIPHPRTTLLFGNRKQRFCSSLCREKQWHKLNPERAREIRKKTKDKHKEKLLAYNRLYYKKNHAKWNVWKRIRYHKNPQIEIQKAINRHRRVKGRGTYSLQDWEELKRKHGYTCLDCGKKEPEIKLTRDHVNPISKGGSNLISNIEPRCQPCNSRKSNH